MSEAERRRYYGKNRVLIEYQRLRYPQFDDAVLYFTGVQIEILRNLMQYARQPEGYVSVYGPDSYLIPAAAEWDEIETIVSDMEETLMGNPNTIWGYKDRVVTMSNLQSDVNGDFAVDLPEVSANEVWRVMGVSVYRDTNAAQYARVSIAYSGGSIAIEDIAMAAVGKLYPSISEFVLKAVDNIRVTYTGATIGETVITSAWGYKMAVP